MRFQYQISKKIAIPPKFRYPSSRNRQLRATRYDVSFFSRNRIAFPIEMTMAYVDEDGSSGSGEDANMLDGHKRHSVVASGSSGRKRSRKANGDAIVNAMLEIANASKMRATAILKNDDRFSISKCIKVLDELPGVDERVYFLALDLFENNSSAREIFISLKGEWKLRWLQCKFSVSSS
ncbi:hypothetical protein RJT34_23368 [Clitoria ternatea]|uniref:Uncharacterized protein n=1 Tax=Clitoria ternatea TaxID=43366 RepID=A0AAN9FRY0_CLITE